MLAVRAGVFPGAGVLSPPDIPDVVRSASGAFVPGMVLNTQ